MKKDALREHIKELLLKEMNTTGTGAHFETGEGEQYATPKAFGKNKKKKYAVSGYELYKQPKKEPSAGSSFPLPGAPK